MGYCNSVSKHFTILSSLRIRCFAEFCVDEKPFLTLVASHITVKTSRYFQVFGFGVLRRLTKISRNFLVFGCGVFRSFPNRTIGKLFMILPSLRIRSFAEVCGDHTIDKHFTILPCLRIRSFAEFLHRNNASSQPCSKQDDEWGCSQSQRQTRNWCGHPCLQVAPSDEFCQVQNACTYIAWPNGGAQQKHTI